MPLILATFLGQPYFAIIVLILLALICVELASILSSSQSAKRALSLLFIATSLSGAAYLYFPAPVLVMASAGIALSAVVTFRSKGGFVAVFSSLVMLCLAAMALLVTADNTVGLLVSVACIIISCDVGAYIVGRIIGGPKLAPAISPGKTISGALGGLLSAMIVASLLSSYITALSANAVMAGLIIGLLSQVGDLSESHFKRRIGIKDSGSIIPGHGGFLDRFDGYLLVMPLIAALMLFRGF